MYVSLKETLFLSLVAGYIKVFSAKNLLKTYRENFEQNTNFDSRSFEDGVQISFVTYPAYRLDYANIFNDLTFE